MLHHTRLFGVCNMAKKLTKLNSRIKMLEVFGGLNNMVEVQILNYAIAHIKDYSGSRWQFCETFNETPFMYPKTLQKHVILVNDEGESFEMSPEAAGFAICALVYKSMAVRHDLDEIIEVNELAHEAIKGFKDAKIISAFLDSVNK